MHDFKKTEEEVLRFWKIKKIYDKSRRKNAKGKKFYFMDGPPYATGHIHMGTALNKILKDVALRYRRIQGYDVFDRPGYDTHGLPIENKVEKKLGFSKKEDIEKYGVKKFIRECKKFATEFIDVMNNEFENLGVWMDFDNPYLTLEKGYIESIWDTFKKAEQKDLLYLGKYPIHACTHCETAVAYNEIEYTKQEDVSVYVKFKIKGGKNKYLIIWTTTPWTLPSNTGVMVHPRFNYVEVRVGEELWILAKERVDELMKTLGVEYKILREFKGKELGGVEYENPLSKHLRLPKLKNAYRVILNERYVNLEEGTGLVHTAPGCGKEDFEAGQKAGLPLVSIVNINGLFKREGGKYAGKKARVVDEEIIEDLEKDNALVLKLPYSHDYPICWRCKSPLIMISAPQWFFRISKIHDKLIKSNDSVNWVPSYMKLRMKAWLEGISDWPISRNRYWGTPLPIWMCNKCHEKEIIGSVKELEDKSGKKVGEVHKPEIDGVKWKCKCGGEMKRVPEVLDVWFDSGVSSWAALGYPQDEKLFKKFWPADLNVEGKDQFRGWWNSQLILSEIRFGRKPYENIVVHGMVLDIGKIKMSKSLGNITSPQEVIEKYGRDQMRYCFSKISKGEDFAFDEKEFRDVQKVFRILVNVNNYVNQLEKKKSRLKTEDKWILSRFNSFLRDVEDSYERFRFPEVIQKVEEFLVNDLSKTYIKIIRDRENEVYSVLNKIRNDLLVVLSPVIPFLTESVWQELKKKRLVKEESIHLCKFPKSDKKRINKKLEREMIQIQDIISVGLMWRDKNKKGIRWPYEKAILSTSSKENKKLIEKFGSILRSQLNVKEVIIKKDNLSRVNIKFEGLLADEGFAREISRLVQAERKKIGLTKNQYINLEILFTERDLRDRLVKYEGFIKDRTNSKKIKLFGPGDKSLERSLHKTDFDIKYHRGSFTIKVSP